MENQDTELEKDSDLGDGYNAYCQYLGLKVHFNSSYNWKKYGGKILATRESYEKRRDKKFFQIIQSKFKPVERNQIFLANFVYDKHLWIGEFLTEHCIGLWQEWKGRIARMEYQFEEDLKNALDEIQRRKGIGRVQALKVLIRKPDNTHPLILRFLWGGMLGIESYLLLSQLLELEKVYKPYLADDRLWADFEFKVKKYGYFLKPKIDLEKSKETLKRITKELPCHSAQ